MEHKGNIICESVNNISVMACRVCGFKHQYPLPSDASMDEYYKDQYFQTSQKDYAERQKRDASYLALINGEKESIIRELMPHHLPNKVLDIGCGDGSLLSFFKKSGWEVKGVEPNHGIIKNVSEELNIFSGTFDRFLDQNNEQYSAISLSGVLEHVKYPKKILGLVRKKLLSDGGIICVEVPNDFNILQKVLVENNPAIYWVSFDHINYFDEKSLVNLLKIEGFLPLFNTVSFPIELFALMGDDYLNHPELGVKAHSKRVSFETNLSTLKSGYIFKQELYEKFRQMGIGRTVICYATKEMA